MQVRAEPSEIISHTNAEGARRRARHVGHARGAREEGTERGGEGRACVRRELLPELETELVPELETRAEADTRAGISETRAAPRASRSERRSRRRSHRALLA